MRLRALALVGTATRAVVPSGTENGALLEPGEVMVPEQVPVAAARQSTKTSKPEPSRSACGVTSVTTARSRGHEPAGSAGRGPSVTVAPIRQRSCRKTTRPVASASAPPANLPFGPRSEEHTSELQSRQYLVW